MTPKPGLREPDVDTVRKKLALLRPMLASAVVGDFSKNIVVPDVDDDFTELFVGVQTMQEVIREQLNELQELNRALEAKAIEHTHALEEAQALTHLGSWEWDVATGIISWSDELYRLYGLKPQERSIGFEEFIDFVHPEDRERVKSVIGAAFASGKAFEFEHRIVLPTGTIRTLYGMGKVLLGPNKKPLRMVGTSQDITERTIIDQALQLSDKRFRAVTHATHDLVYDLDAKDGTLWCNEAISEYGYGKDGTQFTREWWRARIHPEDQPRITQHVTALLKSTENVWDNEYRFQKANGDYAIVRDRAFVLRTPDGKADRLIGSLLDITRQKRLENAKDEFISLASHQLRTPLTVIRMYSQMLGDGMVGSISDAQQKHVEYITEASIKLIDLVGQILTISRLELDRTIVDPHPTDLNELIRQHVEDLRPVAKTKAVRLTFTPEPDFEPIVVDAASFGQVIHNLVENALTYVQPRQGTVHVRLKRRNDTYEFTVRDNGIGIPREAQTHIFERFYRASNSTELNANGTGLGLYLVKLIVDASGGTITCKSAPGKGSTFSVRLSTKTVQA